MVYFAGEFYSRVIGKTMSDEDVQLQAKSSLKAFDDAKSESGFADGELGRVAIRT